MSSHHFVKDGQEPALIIANGEVCNSEILGQLLEWNPFIIVLDGAIERVLQLGIHFDVVLGDFDRTNNIEQQIAHISNATIVHTPNQDYTDLHKAIDWLISKNIKAANIVWATGKRADHTFNNFITLGFFENKINLKIIDNHSVVYPLPKIFSKYYRKNTNISLFPMPVASNINSENLVFELYNATLELPLKTGSSNAVLTDGIVKINYETGCLIMMECID